MSKIPTFRVVSNGVFMVINQNDFDAEIHTIEGEMPDKGYDIGEAQPTTVSAIEAMLKPALMELLERHGISTKGNAPELKLRAIDAFISESE